MNWEEVFTQDEVQLSWYWQPYFEPALLLYDYRKSVTPEEWKTLLLEIPDEYIGKLQLLENHFSKPHHHLSKISDLAGWLQTNCLNYEPVLEKMTEIVTLESWLKKSDFILNSFRKASAWKKLEIFEKLYGAAHLKSVLFFKRLL